jgi:response regulator NasT
MKASERFSQVIQVAVTKVSKNKNVLDEVQQPNNDLAEQQIIDRAKDIIMRQRNLNETEANVMLINMAAKKRMKIVDLANQLIDVAKMLTI